MMLAETSPWFQLIGRLHPMVLHLPIGLLVGLAVVEGLALLRRRLPHPETVRILVWLSALSAIVSAITGYILSLEDGDTTWTLTVHMYLGFAVAAAATLTALAWSLSARPRTYRILLVVTLLMLMPAGHLGATMTHGPDFLTAPFKRAAKTGPAATPDSPDPGLTAPAVPTSPEDVFAARITPIFNKSCVSCHGEARQKGGLALHTLDALLKGGKDGPVMVPGDPAGSEIIRRMRLPLDDDEHMPPKEKPQPTEEEIQAIERWIELAAAMSLPQTGGRPEEAKPLAEPAPPGSGIPTLPPAPAAALQALRDSLVHAEPLSEDSPLLCVDGAAVADRLTDAEARRLLEPLLGHIHTLSLGRTSVGDETVALLARAEHLRRLDLQGTAVTAAGLAPLRQLQGLRELVLARTKLGDEAVEALAAIPALERVYLWHAGLSPEALARLRRLRPDLVVEADEAAPSVGRDAETEVKLTSEAPIPGQETADPPLVVSNSLCPVSGAAVDPRYVVVHAQRLIGFCCDRCPGRFWADPGSFESRLPAAVSSPLTPVNSVCPISGGPIRSEYAVLHKGRVIAFCCDKCPGQFWADPAGYEARLPD